MGLRCSLFGHAFGETATERDRETKGAEVVITVREVRTCTRCGTEQVIAENTEVRHVDTGERATLGDSPGDENGAGTPETETREASPSPSEKPETGSPQGPSPAEADSGPEADSTPDISQFVEQAEEPDSTGDPASSEPGDPSGTAPTEEDVEFIDSDAGGTADSAGEPETADSAGGPETADSAGGPETADSAGGPETADSSDTPETADQAGTPGTAGSADTPGTDSHDGSEPSGDAPGEPGSQEGASAASEPYSSEEDEPDDAIILDDDAGKAERESDLGRRELAGTGNMFDTDAQERQEDASQPSGGHEAETLDGSDGPGPGTSGKQGPGSSEGESREPRSGAADHDPWPDDRESTSDAADTSFQFDSDTRTGAPDAADGDDPDRGPSGIRTGGPVDVSGSGGEDPPRSVVCPECGYETGAMGSSMRAGDICPECHAGYLTERR